MTTPSGQAAGAWWVAVEVDFDPTLVGGSAQLIAAIVGSRSLEAAEVRGTDELHSEADRINLSPQAIAGCRS